MLDNITFLDFLICYMIIRCANIVSQEWSHPIRDIALQDQCHVHHWIRAYSRYVCICILETCCRKHHLTNLSSVFPPHLFVLVTYECFCSQEQTRKLKGKEREKRKERKKLLNI